MCKVLRITVATANGVCRSATAAGLLCAATAAGLLRNRWSMDLPTGTVITGTVTANPLWRRLRPPCCVSSGD
jgi:hypothetical protein